MSESACLQYDFVYVCACVSGLRGVFYCHQREAGLCKYASERWKYDAQFAYWDHVWYSRKADEETGGEFYERYKYINSKITSEIQG